jgi:phosphoribosylamine-glycine ligase
MEFMKKHGIELAPYETFKSMKEAENHVRKTGERYVFKTLGDNEDKALTYVSKHAADMLTWMDTIKEPPKGEVMLQTFIKGIEFGVSRWMGAKGWVGQWNESFEHKKHMSKNFGCNTGEMGTIAAFTKDSKIGVDSLGKMEKALLELGHLGDTAIGFIIDEKGTPYPTEFTMRPGWPIFNMMLGSIEGDPAQWMLDAIEGKDTTSFKEDIGCCLVLTTGDFPHGNKKREELEGFPIYGITKGNKRYLHPQAVKIDLLPDMDGDKIVERPLWNTSGDYNLVVTGYGKDVKQAATRAYSTVDKLSISNMQCRDDVGEGMEEQLPKLHKMGYATHFNYETEEKK